MASILRQRESKRVDAVEGDTPAEATAAGGSAQAVTAPPVKLSISLALFSLFLTVLAVELLLIPLISDWLPSTSAIPHSLLSALLLLIVFAPLLSFIVLRPLKSAGRWLRRNLSERQQTREALEAAEARFHNIVEKNRDAIIVTDLHGKLAYLNPAAESIFNRKAESFIGQNFGLPLINGGLTEIDIIRPGKSPGVGEMHSVQSKWRNQPANLIMVHDITERKRNESRLQLAASVFTHAQEGIIITDAAGIIVDVNRMFSRITGFSRAEVLGKKPSLLKSGKHDPAFYAAMWRKLLADGHWVGEVCNRRKSGERYYETLAIGAVADADAKVQNYVALFSDITVMKEHQQQLEQLAHHDDLTQLPNRVMLVDRLRKAIAQVRRRGLSLAVVFVDLDGFKAVNDRHGHEVGDQLLLVFAQRMKKVLREGDTLSRIGGDEFVAVLIDLQPPLDCTRVLERMLQGAAEPLLIDGAMLSVSASIGATLYPEDDTDAHTLIQHADQAMYEAKQAGKNCYRMFDHADAQ